MTGADGLIAVTPIFNASYSGLFKSFFDVLDPERAGRQAGADRAPPAAPPGTRSRSSTRVRPLFAYLRAVRGADGGLRGPARTGAGGTADGALRDRIDRAAGELADQVDRRAPAPVPDPFALTTSFEDLLAAD